MAYTDTFTRRDRVRRHLNAPLLAQRDEYLCYLLGRGTSERRVQRIARMLRIVIQRMGLDEMTSVTADAIDTASVEWKSDLDKLREMPLADESVAEFRRVATNWLRYRGTFVEGPATYYPYGDIVPTFISFCRDTRGMTEGTVKNVGNRVLWFLRWVEARRPEFAEIELQDVEDYLSSRSLAGIKLRTVASSCQSLRAFFIYAERERLTEKRVGAGIQTPPVPRYDPGPKGPTWGSVRKLIAGLPTGKPTDLRARAVLLLLAIYGLRSSEVTNLNLGDIDWVDESFLVRRAKHGGGQRFPLRFEVGEAILKYLRYGRPKCACRSVFITRNPPYEAITVGSLYTLVHRRMEAAGVEFPQIGPRGFRHACATQLLHKGHSLSEIADFLGHHNTNSVSIYAKPSVSSIRRVAAFSLGGLE